MSEQIIITIKPTADDGFCAVVSSDRVMSRCRFWASGFCILFQQSASVIRADGCLAAARTLREEREAARRVIEAGTWLAQNADGSVRSGIFFDAVAQYEAARGEGR